MNHPTRLPVRILASLACVAAIGTVGAQDAARLKPDPPSAFLSTLNGRNPFWPIGYRPQAENRDEQVERQPVITEIPDESFQISSILLGNPPIAVINGGEYIPGDEIEVRVGGGTTTVRLIAVGDGFIRIRHQGRVQLIRK